jgi:hypothetical protein
VIGADAARQRDPHVEAATRRSQDHRPPFATAPQRPEHLTQHPPRPPPRLARAVRAVRLDGVRVDVDRHPLHPPRSLDRHRVAAPDVRGDCLRRQHPGHQPPIAVHRHQVARRPPLAPGVIRLALAVPQQHRPPLPVRLDPRHRRHPAHVEAEPVVSPADPVVETPRQREEAHGAAGVVGRRVQIKGGG